ncbi:MAG TPA: hypothetical protein PKA27_17190 [Fimbriimonadaceae bacterium]|nr:hypothetical protein [Fimbriimonadaceae bacterium]
MKGFKQFAEGSKEWNVEEIRKDLISDVRAWNGTLYHGTPEAGAICIAHNGFQPQYHNELSGDFLSLSRNPRAVQLFGGSGFVFNAKFSKVLYLSDFYYGLLTVNTGMDIWQDLVEREPEVEEKAQSLGFANRFGSYSIEDGWVFFNQVMPKDIEAIAIDHNEDFGHHNAEAEIAATHTGCRLLKNFVTQIVVDGERMTPQEGWQHLGEQELGDCEPVN